MTSCIQTVLGKIRPSEIGRTLTHEHLYINYEDFYIQPPTELKEYLEGEITLRNVGFVQRYPYSNQGNVSFFGSDLKPAVVDDLEILKKFGGSAIVENTSHGLERNVEFLNEISKETGIHIIAGTGYYLAQVQPNSILNQTVEYLTNAMRTDLISGCPEKVNVKCGVIGEVASTYPIHPFEEKAIKATGMLQEELKCPVTFHPGRDAKAPFEIMRMYTESGGDAKKAVMSHLDRTLPTSALSDFAEEYKCYLQHDLFGTEVLTYQFEPRFQMPSDSQRIERIKLLIEDGYSERVLMSHDIHTKHRLFHFGGHGYFHIFLNIIPKMKYLGISDEVIHQITVTNPRNWLSWIPD